MRRFLIIFAVIFVLSFAVPFISLVEKADNKKSDNNEIVTIFNKNENDS